MTEFQTLSRRWFQHWETVRLLERFLNWQLATPPWCKLVVTLPFKR